MRPDDGRFVRTPYGKVRTEDWLRYQLRKVQQTPPPERKLDRRAVLYHKAVADLLDDRKEPTDDKVAEKLGKEARTIRRWRAEGLLG